MSQIAQIRARLVDPEGRPFVTAHDFPGVRPLTAAALLSRLTQQESTPLRRVGKGIYATRALSDRELVLAILHKLGEPRLLPAWDAALEYFGLPAIGTLRGAVITTQVAHRCSRSLPKGWKLVKRHHNYRLCALAGVALLEVSSYDRAWRSDMNEIRLIEAVRARHLTLADLAPALPFVSKRAQIRARAILEEAAA